MKSFEFTGKNIERAIENGLKELNKNREDVDISIISEGGLFSKAKVVISFEEEDVDNTIKEIIDENESDCCCENCDCCKENCENDGQCEEKTCDCEENCDCECNNKMEEHCDYEECAETVKEELNEKPQREYLSSEEVISKIQEIFGNIFKLLNLNDAKVMVLENDEAYEVKVMGGEKVSCLIGNRGEGLNAYQLLLNNFIELRNKPKKIQIDVENYRNRREESLRGLAQRIAKKVLKTKRSHKFEPMSAYERHVIHEELSNFSGVTTHSEGVEPHRCLIVDIEK